MRQAFTNLSGSCAILQQQSRQDNIVRGSQGGEDHEDQRATKGRTGGVLVLGGHRYWRHKKDRFHSNLFDR